MKKGSHHTEESKQKIGDGNKDKVVSEETRQKTSEAMFRQRIGSLYSKRASSLSASQHAYRSRQGRDK